MILRLLCVIATLLACSALIRADEIELHDGRIFIGQIVDETNSRVRIDTMVSNIRSILSFGRTDILRLQKSELPKDFFAAPNIPPTTNPQATSGAIADIEFIEVPVVGEIGSAVLAEGLKSALEAAERRNITHIVFRINSFGGQVSVAQEMARLLRSKAESLHYTAVVERAISAAIWIVFSCDEIVLRPGATIGAATAFYQDFSTGEIDVDAKMNSALAAELCAIAEQQGINPALIRAMIVPDAACYWVQSAEGDLAIVDTLQDGDVLKRVLSENGSVLTLTSTEASEIGLANISELETTALHQILGLPRWRIHGKIGEIAMESARENRMRMRVLEETRERRASEAEQRRINQLGQQIREIEALVRYINDGIDRAESLHPNNYNYSYNIRDGLFTPESRRAWMRHTDEAIVAWERVDDALGKLFRAEGRARKLGSEANFHELDIQSLRELARDSVRNLLANRKRSGV